MEHNSLMQTAKMVMAVLDFCLHEDRLMGRMTRPMQDKACCNIWNRGLQVIMNRSRLAFQSSKVKMVSRLRKRSSSTQWNRLRSRRLQLSKVYIRPIKWTWQVASKWSDWAMLLTRSMRENQVPTVQLTVTIWVTSHLLSSWSDLKELTNKSPSSRARSATSFWALSISLVSTIPCLEVLWSQTLLMPSLRVTLRSWLIRRSRLVTQISKKGAISRTRSWRLKTLEESIRRELLNSLRLAMRETLWKC